MYNSSKVSVIIPTKNRRGALKQCLDSLAKQTDKNFEVIIVDGGSTDGTEEFIEEYKVFFPIILVRQKEKGLVNAVNEGIERTRGEIVIRTDDDIIADPDWIKEVGRTFDLSEEVGGGTGPTIIPEARKEYRDLFYFQKKFTQGGIFWRWLGKLYFNYFMEGEPLAVSKWFKSGAFSLGSNYPECLKLKEPIEVTHQEACNMATRKILLEKVGGFDKSFTGLSEFSEPDTSFKIKKLGYKIMFNPRAVVYHLPSRDGFFQDRPNSYGRVLNFITFYFRHIKPNTPDKFMRFFSYLLFLNGFWIYKFITTRQMNQMGCIPGTIVGLAKNLFRMDVWRRD